MLIRPAPRCLADLEDDESELGLRVLQKLRTLQQLSDDARKVENKAQYLENIRSARQSINSTIQERTEKQRQRVRAELLESARVVKEADAARSALLQERRERQQQELAVLSKRRSEEQRAANRQRSALKQTRTERLLRKQEEDKVKPERAARHVQDRVSQLRQSNQVKGLRSERVKSYDRLMEDVLVLHARSSEPALPGSPRLSRCLSPRLSKSGSMPSMRASS